MKKSDDLDTRLKIAKSKLENSEIKTDRKKGVFLGNAFKLGTELVAAVAVGSIIGFILDNWFGTKPLLIILFFLFGSAAGIYNVIKAAKKMQENKE
jgi:ATP synthase protein I|tara:strand:- start:81 stop:368 length:288 start_codon:yes stop_codon:yes gene_type:complete